MTTIIACVIILILLFPPIWMIASILLPLIWVLILAVWCNILVISMFGIDYLCKGINNLYKRILNTN